MHITSTSITALQRSTTLTAAAVGGVIVGYTGSPPASRRATTGARARLGRRRTGAV